MHAPRAAAWPNGWRLARAASACQRPRGPAALGVSRGARSANAYYAPDKEPEFGGEDFYAILGVSPAAEPRDIKRAYHSMMRAFHPDRAAVSAASSSASASASASASSMDGGGALGGGGLSNAAVREDAEALCVLLNEIYETLSDEDRRATYDAIAGFSSSAINPFADARFARDQVFVDEVTCIGCGKCVRACPATFEIEASKYGRARVIAQGTDSPDEVQIAIESCPVDCIHWVSLPQLSLLEVALASMGRIEVSVMQRFGRSGGNVFEVAYKAWARRVAAIHARAAAASHSSSRSFVGVPLDLSFWTSGGSLQADEEAEARAAALDPEQRRIASLAASAARAARLWRFYAAATSAAGRGLLSASAASLSSLDGDAAAEARASV